jgi:hypothetical protein
MRGWTPNESALSSVDAEALAILQSKPALATRPITPDPEGGRLPQVSRTDRTCGLWAPTTTDAPGRCRPQAGGMG